MATPQPLNGLKNIAPYVAGESELTGFDRVIKLASNERLFACEIIKSLNKGFENK